MRKFIPAAIAAFILTPPLVTMAQTPAPIPV